MRNFVCLVILVFTEIYVRLKKNNNNENNSSMSPKLTDITFTKHNVESAIKSLQINSAPGPDGMTCEILAKCAPVFSELLATHF